MARRETPAGYVTNALVGICFSGGSIHRLDTCGQHELRTGCSLHLTQGLLKSYSLRRGRQILAPQVQDALPAGGWLEGGACSRGVVKTREGRGRGLCALLFVPGQVAGVEMAQPRDQLFLCEVPQNILSQFSLELFLLWKEKMPSQWE